MREVGIMSRLIKPWLFGYAASAAILGSAYFVTTEYTALLVLFWLIASHLKSLVKC